MASKVRNRVRNVSRKDSIRQFSTDNTTILQERPMHKMIASRPYSWHRG
jgi:hypothetical protein